MLTAIHNPDKYPRKPNSETRGQGGRQMTDEEMAAVGKMNAMRWKGLGNGDNR